MCFAVVPHGSDTAVGIFQVRSLEPAFGTAEWGFALASECWGTGMFVDGAKLVVDFTFDVIGVHRLEARAALKNGRGNGALRKLGAVQEGVLRRSFLRNGEYLDQALWTILAGRVAAGQDRLGFTDHSLISVRALNSVAGMSVMNVRDFDFDLPPDLIAQEPATERSASRMLSLNRTTGVITHTTVAALPEFLESGDVLVVNNTRVFPARLIGRRVPSGGAVECLLIGPVDADGTDQWEALVHPGQKLKPGAHVVFEGAAYAARRDSRAPVLRPAIDSAVDRRPNLGG